MIAAETPKATASSTEVNIIPEMPVVRRTTCETNIMMVNGVATISRPVVIAVLYTCVISSLAAANPAEERASPREPLMLPIAHLAIDPFCSLRPSRRMRLCTCWRVVPWCPLQVFGCKVVDDDWQIRNRIRNLHFSFSQLSSVWGLIHSTGPAMCLQQHHRAHAGLASGPTYRVVYQGPPIGHLPHSHLVQYACFRSGMVVRTRLQKLPPRHIDIGLLYL